MAIFYNLESPKFIKKKYKTEKHTFAKYSIGGTTLFLLSQKERKAVECDLNQIPIIDEERASRDFSKFGSFPPSPSKESIDGKNILFIIRDSTSFDKVERQKSTHALFLRALERESIYFTNIYAPSPRTANSVAALMQMRTAGLAEINILRDRPWVASARNFGERRI